MPKLRYFNRIVWIDSNKNIIIELQQLVTYYEDSLDFFQSASQAQEALQDKKDMQFLIFCSSKMIEDVYKTFSKKKNFFPKFIVFCGYTAKALQIRSNNPYKQAIYNAYCDIAELIIAIQEVEAQVIKFPDIMNNRITINVPPSGNGTSPILQKQQKQQKKSKQKESEKKINEQKKAQKKHKDQELKKTEKQVQKNQEKKAKNKQSSNILIFWAIKQKNGKEQKEIKQNYVDKLNEQGFTVTKIDTVEELRDQLYNYQNKQCIVISRINVNEKQLQENCSNLSLNLKVVEGSQQSQKNNSQQENTYFIHNIQQLLEKLINCNQSQQN